MKRTRTHYEDCYKFHLECALEKIEHLEGEVIALKMIVNSLNSERMKNEQSDSEGRA
jgi:hypothetical protein